MRSRDLQVRFQKFLVFWKVKRYTSRRFSPILIWESQYYRFTSIWKSSPAEIFEDCAMNQPLGDSTVLESMNWDERKSIYVSESLSDRFVMIFLKDQRNGSIPNVGYRQDLFKNTKLGKNQQSRSQLITRHLGLGNCPANNWASG